MRIMRKTVCCAVAALVLGAAAISGDGGHPREATAAGTGYDLSWHTVDGGGGTSTGGGFALSGTIGQPDAGAMSGGSFTLAGGFWPAAAEPGGPQCPGDLNRSGAVDVQDLLTLLGEWGPCPGAGNCPADLDGSDSVDVQDLLLLLAAWGACP